MSNKEIPKIQYIENGWWIFKRIRPVSPKDLKDISVELKKNQQTN